MWRRIASSRRAAADRGLLHRLLTTCAALLAAGIAIEAVAQDCAPAPVVLAPSLDVSRSSRCFGSPEQVFIGDVLTVSPSGVLRFAGTGDAPKLCFNDRDQSERVVVLGERPWISAADAAAPLRLNCSSVVPAAAVRAAGSAFHDQRVLRWSNLYLAGRVDEVLALVETDLESAQPHPFAPQIWTSIHDKRGDLAIAVRMQSIAALGLYPRLRMLSAADRRTALLDTVVPQSEIAQLGDPWTVLERSDAAARDHRAAEVVAAALRSLEIDPTFFGPLARLTEVVDAEPAVHSAVQDALQRKSELPDSAAGRFLAAIVAGRPNNARQKLEAVEDFLEAVPDEPSALKYKAQQLIALERWDDAWEPFELAMTAYPFSADWEGHLAVVLRTHEAALAERVIGFRAAVSGCTTGESARAREESWARALVAAGEKGEARRKLQSALKTSPGDGKLIEILGGLEHDSKRPAAAAAAFTQAQQLDLLGVDARTQYIESLRAESASKAADAFRAFENDRDPTPELIAAGVDAWLAAVNPAEALAAARRGVSRFPSSLLLARSLAECLAANDDKKGAREHLRNAIERAPDHEESLLDYLRWSEGIESDDAVKAQLESWSAAYPWADAVWAARAARAAKGLQGEEAEKASQSTWQEAIRANPGRAWPWLRYTDTLSNMNLQFPALRDGTRELLKSSIAGEFVRVESGLIKMLTLAIEQGDRRGEVLGFLSWALNRFQEEEGSPAVLHSAAMLFYEAQGKIGEAAEALMTAIASDPDDSDVIQRLFHSQSGDRVASSVQFKLLHRHVDRDPYNPHKLQIKAQLHILYGGSPIVGLDALETIRVERPDDYQKGGVQALVRVGKANLGDHRKIYTDLYFNGTHVEQSDRYVNFYRIAREGAQESPPDTQVKFDGAIARLVSRSGEINIREDHPITGMPVVKQVGAVRMDASYDEKTLFLKQLRFSSGEVIDITRREDGKVARLDSKIYGQLTVSEKGGTLFTPAKRGRGVNDEGVSPASSRNLLVRVANAINNDAVERLFELGRNDHRRIKLERRHEEATEAHETAPTVATAREKAESAIALAGHLIGTLGWGKDHDDRAMELIETTVEAAKKTDDGRLRKFGIEAVRLWRRLLVETRPDGLNEDDFEAWNTALEWAAAELTRTGASPEILASLSEPALARLPDTDWLPKSYLTRDGFWRSFPAHELGLDRGGQEGVPRAVLVRKNRDVVVGSSRGLTVLSRGFWTWYGFDESAGRFSRDVAETGLRASSSVTAIAEGHDDSLWIGTENGLIVIPGSYGGDALRWKSTDGLPSVAITALAAVGGEIMVGTTAGLRRFTQAGPNGPPESSVTIRFLSTARDADAPLLVGTESTLYAWKAGKLVPIAGDVKAALWSDSSDEIYMLAGSSVLSAAWSAKGGFASSQKLPDSANIHSSKEIHSLALLPLDEKGEALAVLTDLGLSIYHGHHFENLKVPNAQGNTSVYSLASRDRRVYLITSSGLVGIERGQAMVDSKGIVSDLLTLPHSGVTLAARADRLEIIHHDEVDKGPRELLKVKVTQLVEDRDGGVIFDDGLKVMRLDAGEGPLEKAAPRMLFEIKPGTTLDPVIEGVTSLLAASDGAVWATASSALYRWKDGVVTRFDFYDDWKNKDRFPVQSDTLSRIIETKDGRIWLIASDEGHRTHEGVELTGGVFEWTGENFRRIEVPTPHWFIHNYTRVDRETAIVASSYGMARHRGNLLESFDYDLKDDSYLELKKQAKTLWLASRGARLGDDTWLFGTPRGVVAYRAGQWFYPERINWMLPDPHLDPYGARHVHAVATDPSGNIYVGTDRGMLIYQSGGGNSEAFLLDNEQKIIYERVFSSVEQKKIQQEGTTLVAALDPASTTARISRDIVETRRRIDEIAMRRSATGAILEKIPKEETKKLDEEYERRTAEHTRLLTELETDNYALFQTFQLKPLDLSALHKRLGPKQSVVQYLATPAALYIHLVRQSGSRVLKVDAAAADVDAAAKQVVAALSHSAPRDAAASRELETKLRWLYDALLLPIERDLDGRDGHVFVTAAGSLTYLPFGALLRNDNPREFAVQRYNIAYLPSLYFFDLVFREGVREGKRPVVFADPEGNLPEARLAAAKIQQLLKGEGEPYVGPNASLANFRLKSKDAAYLHLGTHAYLDDAAPGRSFLRLSNSEQLTLVEAMTLKMPEVRIVTLMGCQTAFSAGGLEFATMTRAFAQAGAPSVLATFWKVQDRPSRILVERFYESIAAGKDGATALAEAQRSAIGESADSTISLADWAGYVYFGRP